MKDLIQSKQFRSIIIILGVILALLCVFAGGMELGQRRAQFSYRFDKNYNQNFAGPHSAFSPMRNNRDDMFNTHGAVGEIISLQLPNIVIKGTAEVEKSVIIDDKTNIRQMSGAATTSDLEVGKSVVVIGDPDDSGIIHASLIRITPPQPTVLPGQNISSSTNIRMRMK